MTSLLLLKVLYTLANFLILSNTLIFEAEVGNVEKKLDKINNK